MLKETMTYTDLNGIERTEDFYFNLTAAEVYELEMGTNGGLTNLMDKIVAEQNSSQIVEYFKMILLKAYGEKSLDGKYFNKSPEISDRFAHTQAYSDLFTRLATDADAAAKFFNAIIPAPKNPAASADSPALAPAT